MSHNPKETHPMRKKPVWILIAFLANLALLPLVAGVPQGRAQEARAAFFFDCCQKTRYGRPYCCDRCCIFTWNCLSNEACERREAADSRSLNVPGEVGPRNEPPRSTEVPAIGNRLRSPHPVPR